VDLQCPFATDMCSSFFLKKSDKGALSFMKREIKKYTLMLHKTTDSKPAKKGRHLQWLGLNRFLTKIHLVTLITKGKTTTTKSSKKNST
jgi:hypothetical protein